MFSQQDIKKLKKGKPQAFRKLYDCYHAKVFYYCLKFTRQEDDAEDLTQKIFISLWEKRSTINPDLSFDAYLFTIAHHTACNFLKQKARRMEQQLDDECSLLPDFSTEDQLYLNELTQLARQAIDQLPEKRQIIFKMHFDEMLSEEQIAEMLQLSVNTVKSQLQKARLTIRNLIYDSTRVNISIIFLFLSLLS